MANGGKKKSRCQSADYIAIAKKIGAHSKAKLAARGN